MPSPPPPSPKRRVALVPQEVIDTRHPLVEVWRLARAVQWGVRKLERMLVKQDAAWKLGGRWVTTVEVLFEVMPGAKTKLEELEAREAAQEAPERSLSLLDLIEEQRRDSTGGE
jgi:hypothetical protein